MGYVFRREDETMLFDPFGFKPTVKLASAKENLSLEFEKRNLAGFHHFV